MSLFQSNINQAQQLIEATKERNRSLAQQAAASARTPREAQTVQAGSLFGSALGTGLVRGLGVDEEYNRAVEADEAARMQREQLQEVMGAFDFNDPNAYADNLIRYGQLSLQNATTPEQFQGALSITQQGINMRQATAAQQSESETRASLANQLRERGVDPADVAAYEAGELSFEKASKSVPDNKVTNVAFGDIEGVGTRRIGTQDNIPVYWDNGVWQPIEGSVSPVATTSTKVDVIMPGDDRLDVSAWNTISDNYDRAYRPIRESLDKVNEAKVALTTEGAAATRALQATMANLFSSSVRAQAELERWGNFGPIEERIKTSISQLFKGEYSQQLVYDMSILVDAYERHLQSELGNTNERYSLIAEAAKMPFEAFMVIPNTSTLTEDIRTGPMEDLLNITPEQRENWLPHQKMDYDSRIREEVNRVLFNR